jgi:hypothetical protein
MGNMPPFPCECPIQAPDFLARTFGSRGRGERKEWANACMNVCVFFFCCLVYMWAIALRCEMQVYRFVRSAMHGSRGIGTYRITKIFRTFRCAKKIQGGKGERSSITQSRTRIPEPAPDPFPVIFEWLHVPFLPSSLSLAYERLCDTRGTFMQQVETI